MADCETKLEAWKRVFANQWLTSQWLRPFLYTVNNGLNWQKSNGNARYCLMFCDRLLEDLSSALDILNLSWFWEFRDTGNVGVNISPGWVRRRGCSLQTGWPGPPRCSHSSSSWLCTPAETLKKRGGWGGTCYLSHLIFRVIHPSGSPRKCDLDVHAFVCRTCRGLRKLQGEVGVLRQVEGDPGGGRRAVCQGEGDGFPRAGSNPVKLQMGLKAQREEKSWKHLTVDRADRENAQLDFERRKSLFSFHVSLFVPMSLVSLVKVAFLVAISKN